MKLNKIADISAASFRREKSLTDTIQSALSYVRGLKEYFGVRFVTLCMVEIVEDIMTSNFLVTG